MLPRTKQALDLKEMEMLQVMTKAMAYKIGGDAGNRSMRAACRTVWSVADFNAASKAFEEAMSLVHAPAN